MYRVANVHFREVDRCGGHLPVSAQLQRGDAGVRRLHQLLRVQAQEDLGASQQDGDWSCCLDYIFILTFH